MGSGPGRRLARMAAPPLLLAGALLSAGCGARRVIPMVPAAKLQSASVQQLVTAFNRNANAIRTMTLKLNLTARAGKHKYPRINAYLLTQKPSSLRIWGTFTLVGRLFDMASNGSHFELSLPTRNQFITGLNNVIPEVTPNPLEKLRPQVILNALLINPIPPQDRVALDPSGGPSNYQLLVLEPGPGGIDVLRRRITFSRVDLLPHAQVIYDGDQVHETRASYGDFTTSGGIPIPQDTTIERLEEGYSLRLQIVKGGITLNKPFTQPHTFELTPPTGATVMKLSSDTGLPGAAPGFTLALPGGG